MLQIKTILFDFDGTIADTLSACIKIANDNASSWGFRTVQPEEVEKLKGMAPLEVIKEFKIPLYKVPFLVRKVQKELYLSMNTVNPFPGIKGVIQTLEKNGFHLGIITSNTEENVKRFLKANEITSFRFIHSEKNLFGKARSIENFIYQRRLTKEDVVYIGDEVRDIEAAAKSKVQCISVTWGFNTKKLLKEHGAQHIVDTPKELLDLLKT